MIQQKIDIKKGIYILPSLITIGNIAFGFRSMIFSINGALSSAAWCIIIAIAFDVLDGRVARWTNTTSSFGIELDSLSDIVSFGIAPSILMYQMGLSTLGKPGFIIALFFVIAGALRLAKFNLKAHEGSVTGDFSGLPIPAAAGMLASFTLSYELFEMGPMITVKTIPLLMARMPFFFKSIPVAMILISLLMLSNIPYRGKGSTVNKPHSLQILLLVIVTLLLMVAYPQNMIFLVFFTYLLSGVCLHALRYLRLRRFLARAAQRTHEQE